MADSLEVMICNWRVTRGIPSGLHIWFDPSVESVRLFRVPTSEQRSFEHDQDATLDAGVGPGYLDKVVRMTAVEDEGERYVQIDFLSSSSPDGDEELPF